MFAYLPAYWSYANKVCGLRPWPITTSRWCDYPYHTGRVFDWQSFFNIPLFPTHRAHHFQNTSAFRVALGHSVLILVSSNLAHPNTTHFWREDRMSVIRVRPFAKTCIESPASGFAYRLPSKIFFVLGFGESLMEIRSWAASSDCQNKQANCKAFQGHPCGSFSPTWACSEFKTDCWRSTSCLLTFSLSVSGTWNPCTESRS